MTDALLTRIAAPIGHILHIGAGTGSEIADYLAAGPGAVTLIEPDPDALAHLLTAVAGSGNSDIVRVIGAAISPDPDAGPLHRFAFGDLNSLRAPTGLRDLFPGLEEPEREPVELCDPVTLVAGLELGPARAHVLVIEAPGEALAILQALAAAGLLTRFGAVRVQEGRETLYEGAGSFAQVQALVVAAGFSLDARIDDTDPARPVLSVLFDARAAQVAELGAAGDKLRQERDAGLGELEQVEGRLAAQGEALARATAAREAAETQVAALKGERDAARQQAATLKVERDTARQQAATLKGERDTARQQAATLKGERDAAAQQAETLKGERDAAAQQAETLKGERDAQAGKLEELKRKYSLLELSREDMLRAEGQLEMIKDLLLRGPEL